MTDSSIDNTRTAGGKKQSSLSVFHLNTFEIVIAILTGIGTWIGFRSILRRTLPYGCSDYINGVLIPCGWTYEESWTELGHPLFSSFSVPSVIILAMSAVFLVRAIRRDERYFSTLGNLALAWPLISFPLLSLFSFFSLYCLPVGLGIALIAAIRSTNTGGKLEDMIALILSIAWFSYGFYYFDQWWKLFGD